MDLDKEVLHGVFGDIAVPSADDEEGTDDDIGFFGVEFGEGFVKVFLGGCVDAIETVAVELLIGGRGAGDEEIEKFGRMGIEGAGVAFDGRN